MKIGIIGAPKELRGVLLYQLQATTNMPKTS
jgi:hypothetical protein